MPLLVRCPNGCSIRVPASRAGRVVRCGQCKSAIRIAKVDTSTAGPNDWIRCEAKAVRPVVEVKGQVPDDPVEPVAPPQVTEPESEAVPEVASTELPTPAPTSSAWVLALQDRRADGASLGLLQSIPPWVSSG